MKKNNFDKLFEFLELCLKQGWKSEDLDRLEKLWIKHHDEDGNFLWAGSPKSFNK